jgi:hypothetical protein
MHPDGDSHCKTDRSMVPTLSGIALFLAGAVTFALWQKTTEDGKYATFVKHCQNLSTNDRFAMRLPDGRMILINLLEIPEAYLATLCSDNQPKAIWK